MELSLQNVSVKRRGKHVLGPVSHDFSSTGLTVVLGPNGSGKTTLLRVMHGVERLSSGTVETPITRAEQAFVFQSPIMLRRSVRDNLIYPPALKARNLTSSELNEEVEKWLNIIGLPDATNRPAQRLSGGEKQKLALARALICKPKLLFLDEPTANLDGRSTREIEEILISARDNGTRLILATHNLGQAKRLANDAIFLLSGKIHEAGLADTFFDAPQASETKAFFAGDILE